MHLCRISFPKFGHPLTGNLHKFLKDLEMVVIMDQNKKRADMIYWQAESKSARKVGKKHGDSK
ncbi:hypothetical protein B7C51_16065 [Paenibacillus larvae subsp. pulvifaciens]|uniref:Uncharacterized protein n=1 Tax=Paenibacillus larvae subsp. pulvifaciens TaxID=1477 RepID=A0A1V0UV40_9BACL|nr:hypothetical protein BXP28_20675 [Paenibacillus larvae subsp. larvae]ARF68996.1 hypothetical protein B7C51_16065 [Paenibacillus larvae subsp. pulvifaciens]